MWARSHHPPYLGVSESSAPIKPKPSSTACMAPPNDYPPTSSLKCACTSRSAPDLGTRVLHSGQKPKASGSKSKAPASDN